LYFNDKDLNITQNKRQNLNIQLIIKYWWKIRNSTQYSKENIDIMNNTVVLKDFKNKSNYRGFISDDLKLLLKKHIRELGINDYVIGGLENKYPTTSLQRKLKVILDKNFNKG
jgi:hypothetical protein